MTMGDFFKIVDNLKEMGFTKRQINKFPIYIGDDNELNGIHCAEAGQLIEVSDPEDAYFVNMINKDPNNFEITDKAVLIV